MVESQATGRNPMLKLTQTAAVALESIRRSEGIPEDHGTRLTGDQQPTGDVAIRLEFVEEVPEEDLVTKQAGTEVFVDPDIADTLSDAVLDVQDREGNVSFVFRPQGS
jgi:Fe-S cluster assembly iron-binding protein IscA